jgi:signal transduction histidine kinase
VKFTPASGRVDVEVGCDGAGVEVCVRDTGQGISPDFLPFVFDRFRQADSSTTRGSWGLGIGLSIVRHLVELHGGSIQASSDGLGTGATFVVRLPVHVPVAAGASQPVEQAMSRDVSPGVA